MSSTHDDALHGRGTRRDVVALATRGRGRSSGLDARTAWRNVEFGALLHDVGKVAIPNDDPRTSPGASTPPSGELMQARTRSKASGCSTASVGFMSEVGADRALDRTSAGTAAGIPTGWPARRSRSRPGSIYLLRRLQRDDHDALVPRRDCPPVCRRGRARCAARARQFDPAIVDAVLTVVGVTPADERPLAA